MRQQTVVSAGISVPSPKPADNSTPQAGAFYFGSFIGGATSVTVWSVPVFLPVTPAELDADAAFNGTMTLGAQVSGLPGYDLSITDSSLFVYSNIDIDTGNIGSVSASNVYLASAVINSAPDDHSPAGLRAVQAADGHHPPGADGRPAQSTSSSPKTTAS